MNNLKKRDFVLINVLICMTFLLIIYLFYNYIPSTVYSMEGGGRSGQPRHLVSHAKMAYIKGGFLTSVIAILYACYSDNKQRHIMITAFNILGIGTFLLRMFLSRYV